MPDRSWSSVCGECATYGTAHCAHRRDDRKPEDCFAAICEGFVPVPETQPCHSEKDKFTHSCAMAALEATMERGCCEPAQPLMKPETEEVKAAEAEKRAETAVQGTQTRVSPIGQVTAQDVSEALEGAAAILFKSSTCPNCKAAMALLDRAGVQYAAVNAADARELTAKYGVKQAPTLVVRTEAGFEKYRGVSDIKGWLMNEAHTVTR